MPDVPQPQPADDGLPVIPIGFGTKLGVSSAALAALIAGVLAFVHGNHTPEEIALIATAAGGVFVTAGGRHLQSAALLFNREPDDLIPAPLFGALAGVAPDAPAVDEGDGEQAKKAESASVRRAK